MHWVYESVLILTFISMSCRAEGYMAEKEIINNVGIAAKWLYGYSFSSFQICLAAFSAKDTCFILRCI